MSAQTYFGATTTLKFDAMQLWVLIQEIRNLADAQEEEHGVLVTGTEDEKDDHEMLRAMVRRFEAAIRRIDAKA